MGSRNDKRMATITETAERHFGEKVVKISTPGGESRSSCRLHLESRSVIATLRPNFRRTHLEAYVLNKLAPHCKDTPECLGIVGEVMFQADVGGRRLNQEIARADNSRKLELAQEAVAAIFRIQAAARTAGLNESMPHLGANEAWVRNFVDASKAMAEFSDGRVTGLDRTPLYQAIAHEGRQFVKWDCRSGNAAIGDDNRLRWFDFEYSGLRHGAEDLAWLVGDEAWLIAPEVMLDIIKQEFDPGCGHDRDSYLDYLSLYLTFHCIQRFKLIVKEARKRGWIAKARVRKYDDAGVHPEFAAHICRVGSYFADRNSLTAPIARDFDDTEAMFRNILREGEMRATA